MMELGWGDKEIEVRVPSAPLSDKQARDYLLRSNKNVGEWDWEKLANEFNLDELLAVGFDQEELTGAFEDILKDVGADAGDDGEEKQTTCPECGHKF